jgi:UDP-glucuronate 4-epimerase
MGQIDATVTGTADGSDWDTDERFLVTGSEGCIGAWVVRNLALAGVPVVAVDIAPGGTRLHKILGEAGRATVTHVVGDLGDDGLIDRLIGEHEITRVAHLAALQVPFVAADPILGGTVNVMGTLRVLEAVRGHNDRVRGLVYASSAAAYGPDDAPADPETLYGVFKLCNEHCARLYARDYATPSIGLRPVIVYGPARDQGMTAALTHALKAAVLCVPYEIPFTGLVDAQYTEDVAISFIRSALVDGNDGASVYDLHGTAVHVPEFIAAIERVMPEAAGLVTCGTSVVPGRLIVSDADLMERIGGQPKTALDEGIRRSLAVFEAHRREGILRADDIPVPA